MKKEYLEKKDFIESLLLNSSHEFSNDIIKNLDVYESIISQIDKDVFNNTDYHLFSDFFKNFFNEISDSASDSDLYVELKKYEGYVIDKIYDLIVKTREAFSINNSNDDYDNCVLEIYRHKAYQLHLDKLEDEIIPNYLLDYHKNNRLVDYYDTETGVSLAHRYTEIGILPNDFPFFWHAANDGCVIETVAHWAAMNNTLPDDFDQWKMTGSYENSVAHYYARFSDNFDASKIKDHINLVNEGGLSVLDVMIKSGEYFLEDIKCPLKRLDELHSTLIRIMGEDNQDNWYDPIYHNDGQTDNMVKFIEKVMESILRDNNQKWLLKDAPEGSGYAIDYAENLLNDMISTVRDFDENYNPEKIISTFSEVRCKIMDSLFNSIDTRKISDDYDKDFNLYI